MDGHDSNCDHLLVLDAAKKSGSQIVGTQRFFLKTGVAGSGDCYSQQEFDVAALISRKPGFTFMELGRSCILPEYRSKRTMELMWQGTWAYAVENRVDVMLGCASFHCDNLEDIRHSLGFLSKYAAATEDWQVSASVEDAIEMKPFEALALDARSAIRQLPPLLKGYLRLGAMFSVQAVPDPEFGTIDVLVILPVDRINRRYVNYYGEDASKHRA